MFYTFEIVILLSQRNAKGDKIIEMALKKPENIVLKHQRKGGDIHVVTYHIPLYIILNYRTGVKIKVVVVWSFLSINFLGFTDLGHNYFDDALKHKLLQLIESEERATYILMDCINSPVQNSVIISSRCHCPVQINSEIGIYGVFIR